MSYCIELSYLELFEKKREEGALFYAFGASCVRGIQVILDALALALYALKVIWYSVSHDSDRLLTNGKLALLSLYLVVLGPFQIIGFTLALLCSFLSQSMSYALLAMSLRPSVKARSRISKMKKEMIYPRWRKRVEVFWIGILRKVSKVVPEVVLPFFLEPRDVLGAGILYPLQNEHRLHNLNPKEKVERPIICVHGDKHNQTAWFPLAHTMGQDLFTLNLKSGEVTDEDVQALLAKVDEVVKDEKITFVGHSRGVEVIERFIQAYPERVDQVITLGTPICDDSVAGLDILATLDEIVPHEQARKNCIRVREGHLSMLSSPLVHCLIQSQLDNKR